VALRPKITLTTRPAPFRRSGEGQVRQRQHHARDFFAASRALAFSLSDPRLHIVRAWRSSSGRGHHWRSLAGPAWTAGSSRAQPFASVKDSALNQASRAARVVSYATPCAPRGDYGVSFSRSSFWSSLSTSCVSQCPVAAICRGVRDQRITPHRRRRLQVSRSVRLRHRGVCLPLRLFSMNMSPAARETSSSERSE